MEKDAERQADVEAWNLAEEEAKAASRAYQQVMDDYHQPAWIRLQAAKADLKIKRERVLTKWSVSK